MEGIYYLPGLAVLLCALPLVATGLLIAELADARDELSNREEQSNQ